MTAHFEKIKKKNYYKQNGHLGLIFNARAKMYKENGEYTRKRNYTNHTRILFFLKASYTEDK